MLRSGLPPDVRTPIGVGFGVDGFCVDLIGWFGHFDGGRGQTW